MRVVSGARDHDFAEVHSRGRIDSPGRAVVSRDDAEFLIADQLPILIQIQPGKRPKADPALTTQPEIHRDAPVET